MEFFKTEVEFENAVKEAEDLANEIEKDFKGKLNTQVLLIAV